MHGKEGRKLINRGGPNEEQWRIQTSRGKEGRKLINRGGPNEEQWRIQTSRGKEGRKLINRGGPNEERTGTVPTYISRIMAYPNLSRTIVLVGMGWGEVAQKLNHRHKICRNYFEPKPWHVSPYGSYTSKCIHTPPEEKSTAALWFPREPRAHGQLNSATEILHPTLSVRVGIGPHSVVDPAGKRKAAQNRETFVVSEAPIVVQQLRARLEPGLPRTPRSDARSRAGEERCQEVRTGGGVEVEHLERLERRQGEVLLRCTPPRLQAVRSDENDRLEATEGDQQFDSVHHVAVFPEGVHKAQACRRICLTNEIGPPEGMAHERHRMSPGGGASGEFDFGLWNAESKI
ncbi:hypothetical protein C8R43DRAFT_1106988 [Mycena crocata]|nr:hypothetical protein C8R43DRAFT_1106988 [Mycena crocata]